MPFQVWEGKMLFRGTRRARADKPLRPSPTALLPLRFLSIQSKIKMERLFWVHETLILRFLCHLRLWSSQFVTFFSCYLSFSVGVLFTVLLNRQEWDPSPPHLPCAQKREAGNISWIGVKTSTGCVLQLEQFVEESRQSPEHESPPRHVQWGCTHCSFWSVRCVHCSCPGHFQVVKSCVSVNFLCGM